MHLGAEKPVGIVTGISRGYGKAVARALLDSGWQIVGDGRDPNTLAAAEKELQAYGGLVAIAGDIGDEAHLREIFDRAQSLGNVQLLVNNAGTLGPSPLPALADLKTAELSELFRINVLAALSLIQLALPALSSSPRGVVINVTSDAGAGAYEGWGGYGASKAALDHLTSVLAVEVPDIGWYALDPGDMRTQMHQAAFPGEDISDRPDPVESAPAVVMLAEGKLPSGRFTAQEVIAQS